MILMNRHDGDNELYISMKVMYQCGEWRAPTVSDRYGGGDIVLTKPHRDHMVLIPWRSCLVVLLRRSVRSTAPPVRQKNSCACLEKTWKGRGMMSTTRSRCVRNKCCFVVVSLMPTSVCEVGVPIHREVFPAARPVWSTKGLSYSSGSQLLSGVSW